MAGKGIRNYLEHRPLSVSFEVTYACNARCKHCHLGGPVPGEKHASAEQYAELCREIKPFVAQISGGEPLLRRDIEEIVRALATRGKAAMIVMTTNAALLTKDRYLRLREAGVDEFSVSLDYPDDRHDAFRGIPGLFRKIEGLIQELHEEKRKAITFSCVVQRDNFLDLPALARLAIEWDVRINFSTYTWLRTKDMDYMVPKDRLDDLRSITGHLLEIRRKHNNVFASEYVFNRMIEFFENGGIPDCRAGERFFIVNPDATLSPCGLIPGRYKTRKELRADFMPRNTCTECNTSIRANCEKPLWFQFKDNIKNLFG